MAVVCLPQSINLRLFRQCETPRCPLSFPSLLVPLFLFRLSDSFLLLEALSSECRVVSASSSFFRLIAPRRAPIRGWFVVCRWELPVAAMILSGLIAPRRGSYKVMVCYLSVGAPLAAMILLSLIAPRRGTYRVMVCYLSVGVASGGDDFIWAYRPETGRLQGDGLLSVGGSCLWRR